MKKKEQEIKEYKVYGDGTKGLKNFFSLLSFYKPYKWYIVLWLFLELFPIALSVIIPIYTAQLVAAITSSDVANLLIYAAIVFGGEIVSQMIHCVINYFVLNKFMFKATYDIKLKLTRKLLSLKMQNFDKANSGFFLRVIDGAVWGYIHSTVRLIDYVFSILTKLFYMGFTIFLNVWLGLFIVGSFIVTLVIRYIRVKWNTKKNKALQEKGDIVSSFTNETLRGIRDIKYSKIEDEVYQRNVELQNDYKNFDFNFERNSDLFFRLGSIVGQGMNLGFFGLMAYLLAIGNVTPINALTLYNFYGRTVSLANVINNLMSETKRAELSSFRINQVLSGYKYGFEEYGIDEIDMSKKKNVQFKNVTFAYEEEQVLKNISFKIKENTTVGIAGESGAGKSTIIRLLSKMYDVSDGEVIVAGSNIKDLSRESLRKLITVVPQDPYIFNMTFRENLTIVKPDATEEEIIDAFTKAQLYDFITSQKDGLDTKLGENGIVLSGGQKQRLAIARGLLIASPILILDEATSSLDNENQEKIKNVIASLSGSRTVIIIAHRLSTIIDADEILFIKNGKVAKRGSHKYLMENCKDYNKFYQGEN